MAKKHLSRETKQAFREEKGKRHTNHPDVWWYEEPGHLSLHVYTGQEIISARIPINQLRAFIERHDRGE